MATEEGSANAKKAWPTVRNSYTDEQIHQRSVQAGLLAAETKKWNKLSVPKINYESKRPVIFWKRVEAEANSKRRGWLKNELQTPVIQEDQIKFDYPAQSFPQRQPLCLMHLCQFPDGLYWYGTNGWLYRLEKQDHETHVILEGRAQSMIGAGSAQPKVETREVVIVLPKL